MFIDSARITVQGGDGGRGCVSFRREKYVPRGGPDGGDGGDGGCVICRATSSVNTLMSFRYRKTISAKRGTHGQGKQKHGQKGEDAVLEVPVGTLVRDEDTGEIIADLNRDGMRATIARGGRGGKGNARFKSSTRQTPRYAQEGLSGEKRNLYLELRLLADVGLIGAPNAGKSSLLARISESRPKIAEYPFSTLHPVLGVVDLGENQSCVAADIPGLIEGAHLGKGLGSRFLQHIQRTKVLVHVVDLSPAEGSPAASYRSVKEELLRFDPALGDKPVLVAPNKMDLPCAREALAEFQEEIGLQRVYPISAATGEGISGLLHAIRKTLAAEEALV